MQAECLPVAREREAARAEAEALAERLTLTTEDLAEAEKKAVAWMREWEKLKEKSPESRWERVTTSLEQDSHPRPLSRNDLRASGERREFVPPLPPA